MNQGQTQRKRLIVVGLLVAAVVCVLGVAALNSGSSFRIVSTNPSLNSIATQTPFLKVTFTKQLASNGLHVSGDVVKSYSASGTTLTILLNYPLKTQKYTLIITANDTTGDHIANDAITFKPQIVNGDNLPDDQKQALINDQDKNQGLTGDPIISKLPYTTPNFSLQALISTGANGKDQLTLQATIYLNQAQASGDQASQDALVAGYKQQILGYISSVGLNPANYTINYRISTPSNP